MLTSPFRRITACVSMIYIDVRVTTNRNEQDPGEFD